jgi:hypothetical protein
LSFLDRLKQWKDGNRSGAVAIGRSCTADQTAGPNITMPRGPWRPKPAGIHRILLPLASLLLIPDYLLGKCGIGACLWTLSHKK